MDKAEGIPALLYSIFWQTRELGFLKQILNDLNIDSLRLLVFFEEYKPGALITLNGEKGDYSVLQVDEINDLQYDCAIIGSFKAYSQLMGISFYFTRERLANLVKTRKIRIKGIKYLLKFSELIIRLAT